MARQGKQHDSELDADLFAVYRRLAGEWPRVVSVTWICSTDGSMSKEENFLSAFGQSKE